MGRSDSAAATLRSTDRNSTVRNSTVRNSNPTDDNRVATAALVPEVATRRLLCPRHITFYTRSSLRPPTPSNHRSLDPPPTSLCSVSNRVSRRPTAAVDSRPTDDLSIQSHLLCFQLHHPATTLTRIDSDPSDSPTVCNYNRYCGSRIHQFPSCLLPLLLLSLVRAGPVAHATCLHQLLLHLLPVALPPRKDFSPRPLSLLPLPAPLHLALDTPSAPI
eukprot:jgi/Psemu1/56853/gm1.56853_g